MKKTCRKPTSIWSRLLWGLGLGELFVIVEETKLTISGSVFYCGKIGLSQKGTCIAKSINFIQKWS